MNLIHYISYNKECEYQINDDITYTNINFNDIEKQLNELKQKLFNKRDVRKLRMLLSISDPFMNVKHDITREYGFTCTNAWLKLIQLIVDFDIFNTSDNLREQHRKIRVFDNANFPGMWINTIKYYTSVKHIDYEWFASSLFNKNDTELKDDYNIYMKNREHYVMDGNKCKGDMTCFEDIDYIAKFFAESKIDVYTSDLGMNVGDDYDNQEVLHELAFFGQILLAIKILNRNGNLIIKQYTYFKEFTMSLIYLLSMCFEEVCISKPNTSRHRNSEIYIIGKKFIPPSDELMCILDTKFKFYQQSPKLSYTHLPALFKMPDVFISELRHTAIDFSKHQIDELMDLCETYDRFGNLRMGISKYKNELLKKYSEGNKQEGEKWKHKYIV